MGDPLEAVQYAADGKEKQAYRDNANQGSRVDQNRGHCTAEEEKASKNKIGDSRTADPFSGGLQDGQALGLNDVLRIGNGDGLERLLAVGAFKRAALVLIRDCELSAAFGTFGFHSLPVNKSTKIMMIMAIRPIKASTK